MRRRIGVDPAGGARGNQLDGDRPRLDEAFVADQMDVPVARVDAAFSCTCRPGKAATVSGSSRTAAWPSWNASETRVVGGPAIARNGRRIAFTVRRQDGRTLLSVANIDGTNARIVPTPLELQGAPAWAPDGETVTVAARVDGVPRLFNVPLDGRAPVRVVNEHAVDPVWSPDGDVVVFSGADIGTTFPLRAATRDGRSHRVPQMMLTRGARHIAFVPGQRSILVLRGEVRHKNLWSVDLVTGAERQLTHFEPGFDIRDFDISPDGQQIVIEQVHEHSDIVLLDVRRE